MIAGTRCSGSMIAGVCFVLMASLASVAWADGGETADSAAKLEWSRLPPLPEKLGVAGAFAGVDHDALIWTDTIQTVVLLGGAVLAFVLLVGGVDGGWGGCVCTGIAAGKFRMVNFHWDVTSAQIAMWVIVLGGIGQHFSS